MAERLEILKITPQEPVSRKPRKGFGSSYRFPSKERQTARLGERMAQLSSEIEAQNYNLQMGTQGIDPEFVLVFEIVGSVDTFANAAKRAGLDWLGEFDGEPFVSNDDFKEIKSGKVIEQSMLPQKLYLTLTNQRSMRNIIALWNRYQRGEAFEWGTGGFKNVFNQLTNIRRWDVTDRLDDTGIIPFWSNSIDNNYDKVRFEIELWYRSNERERTITEKHVRDIVEGCGGCIIKTVVYPDIAYHAMLVECPINIIKNILETRDSLLVKSDKIMFFRATGQVLGQYPIKGEENENELNITNVKDEYPSEPPVIALLDGFPMQNHTKLENRLNIEDIFGLEEGAIADKRIHGTAMASLIIHGDLSNPYPCFKHYLYVIPIMKYNARMEVETIPDDELFVDILARSVIHIMEETELGRTIRIINLSVVDENALFLNAFSPEARMIDFLSYKYGLVFVICAGNYSDFIVKDDMTYGEFQQLSLEEKQKIVFQDRFGVQRKMRIQAPAEAENALCVGALQKDNAPISPYEDRDLPIADGYPAAYSRFGGGYQRALKPDCVFKGGREIYRQNNPSNNSPLDLRPSYFPKRGPGLKVAGCETLTGEIFLNGTSNSAALVSRLCAEILPAIRNVRYLNIDSSFESIALKTMLIHSCSWDNMGHQFMDHILDFTGYDARKRKDITLHWIGYGIPHISNILWSTSQRVVMVDYGSIEQDKSIEYRIPLPPCLISQAIYKRLTITLGWHTPISPNNKNYKLAKLSFMPNNDIIDVSRSECDQNTGKRGTIQHEVFEGNKASTFIEGSNLVINIECKKETSLSEHVKYFLAVTLEVKESTGLPIYQEIRERIHVSSRIQA